MEAEKEKSLLKLFSMKRIHFNQPLSSGLATNTKSILFKACLFNLTFHKGSHSKGLKQKSTASKKNKIFHSKVFCAAFHGSTNLFQKCENDPLKKPFK